MAPLPPLIDLYPADEPGNFFMAWLAGKAAIIAMRLPIWRPEFIPHLLLDPGF